LFCRVYQRPSSLNAVLAIIVVLFSPNASTCSAMAVLFRGSGARNLGGATWAPLNAKRYRQSSKAAILALFHMMVLTAAAAELGSL
jgi:hypothetical protein